MSSDVFLMVSVYGLPYPTYTDTKKHVRRHLTLLWRHRQPFRGVHQILPRVRHDIVDAGRAERQTPVQVLLGEAQQQAAEPAVELAALLGRRVPLQDAEQVGVRDRLGDRERAVLDDNPAGKR